jgi:1-acyl-sn-glycerol-3-phosphate acyltransferase
VIVAPHTSNWDFPVAVLCKFAFGMRIKFLGKHTLFSWYGGWFFRMLGGLPVRRDKRDNLVQQVAHYFRESPDMIVALAPEGTRKYTPYWRSGFYRMAQAANVPVLMAYIDAGKKEMGLGPLLHLSGDEARDMAIIREFYADKQGIVPDGKSHVRLRSEIAETAAGGRQDRNV